MSSQSVQDKVKVGLLARFPHCLQVWPGEQWNVLKLFKVLALLNICLKVYISFPSPQKHFNGLIRGLHLRVVLAFSVCLYECVSFLPLKTDLYFLCLENNIC